MRVEELLVKGGEHAVLWGVLSQFPALSWLKMSLEATWRAPAVLEQDVLSCLSLGGSWGDPGGNLLGGHSSGTGG